MPGSVALQPHLAKHSFLSGIVKGCKKDLLSSSKSRSERKCGCQCM